jgi:hypothetical protein
VTAHRIDTTRQVYEFWEVEADSAEEARRIFQFSGRITHTEDGTDLLVEDVVEVDGE